MCAFRNGVSRNRAECPSPPSAMSTMRMIGATCSASVKEVATGFVVPFRSAEDGVDVQVEHVRHVGRDAAAGEPRDVRERVLQPREVVEVPQRRRAVASGVHVERLHGRPAGPEEDASPADVDRARGVAPVERELARRARDETFDHLPREPHAIACLLRTGGEQAPLESLGHIPHAKLGEQPERRGVDPLEVRVGKRSVGAAELPRRARIDGGGGAARGDLRGAATGATGGLRGPHREPSLVRTGGAFAWRRYCSVTDPRASATPPVREFDIAASDFRDSRGAD